MKKPLIALALQIVLATSHAAPPTSLEVLPGGAVQIHGGSADGCQIKPVLVDFSSGKWRGFDVRAKIEPISGLDVSEVLPMVNDDGAVYDFTIDATIKGGALIAKGAWSGESPVQGFGRLDFWVPETLASDLVIECDGQPVFTSPGKTSKVPPDMPLVFRQSENGQFLFRLKGSFFAGLEFLAKRRDAGLTVRLTPFPKTSECQILDYREITWEIDFQE